MSRVQYTFTFTNALPGAEVNFGQTDVFSSATDPDRNVGQQLDADSTVTVWADAASLTAHTTDGLGESLAATATAGSPSVTSDDGTAGTSPFGSGTSATVVVTTAAHYVASDSERVFCSAADTTDVTAPAPGGKSFTVTNTGVTGSVTVLPNDAEGIVAADSFEVGPRSSVTFADDNTDWWGI